MLGRSSAQQPFVPRHLVTLNCAKAKLKSLFNCKLIFKNFYLILNQLKVVIKNNSFNVLAAF